MNTSSDSIPRYALRNTLGESKRATVYLAHSASLGCEVALKVGAVVRGEESQFAHEYQTIGHLSHPGIVDIYDYGFHGDREYIAMEYFPCGDLRARLRHRLTPAQALHYVRGIAWALTAVHEQGVVHRDLKPANIMLRENGQVVLIDFGIARQVGDQSCTAAGILRGSPYYMSPEQAKGKALDGRSDLYSLGVIFHELLTGAKPYEGKSAVEVLQQHVSAPLPQLPPELAQHQQLLNCLMAKSRNARFADARELYAALSEKKRTLPESWTTASFDPSGDQLALHAGPSSS